LIFSLRRELRTRFAADAVFGKVATSYR